MKKLLILLAGFLATQTYYSQCNIIGNNFLKKGEVATFMVDTNVNCDECYSWKSSDEKTIQIAGNSKLNKINVNAIDFGKSTLSVSVATSEGTSKCEKTIEVVDNASKPLKINCGIKVNDFKDVKVNDALMSFFPNVSSSEYYIYKWKATYSNGEVKESEEKIPQFPNSESNYISEIKLKVTSQTPPCSISITKEISLDVDFGGINSDPWGNTKAGFSFEGKIKRSDFGLTWNAALETGGVMVSEEVKIAGELQFVKQ